MVSVIERFHCNFYRSLDPCTRLFAGSKIGSKLIVNYICSNKYSKAQNEYPKNHRFSELWDEHLFSGAIDLDIALARNLLDNGLIWYQLWFTGLRSSDLLQITSFVSLD